MYRNLFHLYMQRGKIMKYEKLIVSIFGKFGYIGFGMFLAALFEYGANKWTVLGLILASLIIAITELGKDEKIKLTFDEYEEDDEEDETV